MILIRKKRDGQGRDLKECSLDRAGHRARIGYILLAQVGPSVDAGDEQRGLSGQKLLCGQIDTVSRGPVHRKNPGLNFLDPQRMVEGEGKRRGAFFSVWSDDVDFPLAFQTAGKGLYPFSEMAIIVCQKDQRFHISHLIFQHGASSWIESQRPQRRETEKKHFNMGRNGLKQLYLSL